MFSIPFQDNAQLIPAGIIWPWAGNQTGTGTYPSGWLICDGTAYTRTNYPKLYNIITFQQSCTMTSGSATVTVPGFTIDMRAGLSIEGTNLQATTSVSTYAGGSTMVISKTATASGTATITFFPWGNGDGSATFNVPDMRGLTLIGAGAAGGGVASLTARQVGSYGGEEKHTLTVGELAAHTHSYTSFTGGNALGGSGTPTNVDYGSGSSTSGSQGSNTAHNIMQPYGVVYYIIKY